MLIILKAAKTVGVETEVFAKKPWERYSKDGDDGWGIPRGKEEGIWFIPQMFPELRHCEVLGIKSFP